jgi:TM2 domain-containing membrane protein YozV
MEEKIIVQKTPKSPALAGILSFFFPFGIGAFYNGEIVKGFIYLIIFAGLVTMQPHSGSQPFAGLVLAGFYFFQIIDSINVAKRINRRALRGEEAKEGEEELITEAVKSGSVFWGALLIALGAILLLGNFEVISYERIFDFWPLVVIVIGIKLVADYFSRNKQSS